MDYLQGPFEVPGCRRNSSQISLDSAAPRRGYKSPGLQRVFHLPKHDQDNVCVVAKNHVKLEILFTKGTSTPIHASYA